MDYTASGTIITINPGSTTGTITLTAVQDAVFEGNETIVIAITAVTNGTAGAVQQVSVTIADDEVAPQGGGGGGGGRGAPSAPSASTLRPAASCSEAGFRSRYQPARCRGPEG